MNDAMILPTISVITPSFNQAPFLSDCLQSVAEQTHKALEHLVLDPGSEDGSRDIAEAFPGVTLIAEPDRGQADAVNKGFQLARGEILAWLNSDDQFAGPDVFEKVAQAFAERPTVDVIYGRAIFVDENNEFLKDYYVNGDVANLLTSFEKQVGICQPSVFLHRRVVEKVGGPSVDLTYQLDFEYWIRIAQAGFVWHFLPEVLAKHRWWPGMKTAGQRGASLYETLKTVKQSFGYVHCKWAERVAQQEVLGNDGIIATGSGETSDAVLEAEARVLRRCNGDWRWFSLLEKPNASQGVRETANRMQALGVPLAGPCARAADTQLFGPPSFFAPGDETLPKGWRPYIGVRAADEGKVVGYELSNDFHWLFDHDWFSASMIRARQMIEHGRSTRRGDACIVVGNGPSLNRSDLSLLQGVDTIVSNFALLSPTLMQAARYYTVVNHTVAEQAPVEIGLLSGVTKVFPYWIRPFIAEDDETYFLNATTRDGFSTDAASWISWRSTVSFFNLQLAFSLGYTKVIMIGFDHHYVQQTGAVEGDTIVQRDDDPNHFDPRYFRGKTWQAADVQKMEQMYLHAKRAFEAAGREIVNCTVGGHLELFRRGDLADEIGGRTAEPVAETAAPLAVPAAAASPTIFGPSPDFDEIAYLESNPDVAEYLAAGLLASGREHYLRYGRAEGRKGEPQRTRAISPFLRKLSVQGAPAQAVTRQAKRRALFLRLETPEPVSPGVVMGQTVLCSINTYLHGRQLPEAESVFAYCWNGQTVMDACHVLHQMVQGNPALHLILPQQIEVTAVGRRGIVETSVLFPAHPRLSFVPTPSLLDNAPADPRFQELLLAGGIAQYLRLVGLDLTQLDWHWISGVAAMLPEPVAALLRPAAQNQSAVVGQ